MPKVLVSVTTYNRPASLEKVLEAVRAMSINIPYSDISVWNNGDNVTLPSKDIKYFKGVNSGGLMQKFIPSLLFDYDHVMFIDDDLLPGRLFLEDALNLIQQDNSLMVVSGGSVVIPATFNRPALQLRREVHGYVFKNDIPWHVDIGMLGCAVIRREHIRRLFKYNLNLEGTFCGEEIALSMVHAINGGRIVISPHTSPDNFGIKQFLPEHSAGLGSRAGYVNDRLDVIMRLGSQLGWKPSAANYPEWLSMGRAREAVEKKDLFGNYQQTSS